MTTRKIFIYAGLGVLLTAVGILVGFKLRDGSPSGESYQNKVAKFEEVMRLINENYFEPVDNTKLVDDAINGMLSQLDPHTFLIPAKELKEINQQMQGSFDGIGIEFSIIDDTIFVVTPISNGPSYRLGILAGDRIVNIDGENVAGIGITNSDVTKKLRGPKNTTVKVKIKRQGVKNLIEYEITRDKIPMNSLDFSYMIDKKNGYIKINRFAETTFNEFLKALESLKAQGMENLILDLRGNPGGYLEVGQRMADAFLSEGKMIVYTKGRVPGTDREYKSGGIIDGWEKGGLVILINRGSASASEIVSGAVQDWDRGLIVGTRSFGKGLVQHQYPLQDESAIRVVVSRFYTPSGRCIQKPYNKGNKGNYNAEIYERIESGELFDKSKIKFVDSLKYKTNSGRIVYGGGGIMPDIFVPEDTSGITDYLTALVSKNIFHTFAHRWSEENPNLKNQYKDGFDYAKNYTVSDKVMKDFFAYATDKGVPFNEKEYNVSKKYIQRNLKALIGRKFFNNEGYYPVVLQSDQQFLKAVSAVDDARKLERTGKFKN